MAPPHIICLANSHARHGHVKCLRVQILEATGPHGALVSRHQGMPDREVIDTSESGNFCTHHVQVDELCELANEVDLGKVQVIESAVRDSTILKRGPSEREGLDHASAKMTLVEDTVIEAVIAAEDTLELGSVELGPSERAVQQLGAFEACPFKGAVTEYTVFHLRVIELSRAKLGSAEIDSLQGQAGEVCVLKNLTNAILADEFYMSLVELVKFLDCHIYLPPNIYLYYDTHD